MKELDKEQLDAVLESYPLCEKFLTFEDNLKEKGLIKEDFKTGDWIKKTWNDGDIDMFLCNKVTSERYYHKSGNYFRNGEGLYSDYGSCDIDDYRVTFSKPTNKEVEELLIKEAKKRGFKEGVKTSHKGVSNFTPLRFNHLEYYSDMLCDGWGNVLFSKGVWAEIIPCKKELTIKQIEEKLGFEIKIIK